MGTDFKSVMSRDEQGRWVRLPRTPARTFLGIRHGVCQFVLHAGYHMEVQVERDANIRSQWRIVRPGRSGGELSAAIAITGAGVTGLPVIRTAPRLTSIATTSSKLPAEFGVAEEEPDGPRAGLPR